MNANQRFAVLGLLLMLGLGVIAARGPWEHAPKKLASPVRVESPAPVAPEPLIPVFIKVSHPISDRAARELALGAYENGFQIVRAPSEAVVFLDGWFNKSEPNGNLGYCYIDYGLNVGGVVKDKSVVGRAKGCEPLTEYSAAKIVFHQIKMMIK